MKISDQTTWDEWVKNNTDGYGKAVIDYAERWANMMEARMDQGEELEDVSGPTSHEADEDGITGFMYGAAVAVLASCWEHGDKLRRWHNLETQIGNEEERANDSGGVLNPALLSIE